MSPALKSLVAKLPRALGYQVALGRQEVSVGARHIGSVGIVCCVPVIMVASQVDGWHLCETCTRHRLANSARLNCRAKTSNTVIRFPRASEAVSHSKIPFLYLEKN